MKVIKDVWWHHSLQHMGRRMTACCIITEDDRAFIGLAVCSYPDNFNKAIGRDKSYERAKSDPTFEITHMLNKSDKPRKTFCNYCKEHIFPEFLNNKSYYKFIDKHSKDFGGTRVKDNPAKFNLITFFRNLIYGKSSNN